VASDTTGELTELKAFFEEVVLPLLKAGDADGEVLALEDEEVLIRVSGKAAYGVGSHHVRTGIIEQAIRELRPGLRVRFERKAVKPVKVS